MLFPSAVILPQAMEFRFFEPGRLIDHELELIAPALRHVDDLLFACNHPLTVADESATKMTRQQVLDLLKAAPGGHHPGDPRTGRVPGYHFWMLLHPVVTQPLPRWGVATPPLRIAGTVGLRIGSVPDIEMYFGNLGYNVFPAARGNHYAERACRLLLPLARSHGMKTIWITCNPENAASRKTCERLGATMTEIVDLPPGNVLYERGERKKCRYRLGL